MSTARLFHFQTQFREFLYRGHHEHDLAAQVRVGSSTSANARLDVYRNAYFIRLEAALAHDFPVTETVLGKNAFARCAGHYVLTHPSGSPSLREFGREFPGWLRAGKTPILSDLAAIEWAALLVFDGPDATAEDTCRLQTFEPGDWPNLDIQLMPTLTLLALTSNADRMWLEKGKSIELHAMPARYLAIWRGEQCRPMLLEMDADCYAVLNAVAKQSRLLIASEQLARDLDPATVPQRIAVALHRALAHGWIARIKKHS